MKIDTSEIKTYRECHRKHEFSSRNRFHLRPIKSNDNLVFGTQFHEVLAMIYLGTSEDKILEWITREVTDPQMNRMMNNMFEGYYHGPYQQDKERYVLVDIEKSFNYPIAVNPTAVVGEYTVDHEPWDFKQVNGQWVAVDNNGELYDAICVCGSIDMICIDTKTGKLVGFEHKTAKNFRPEVYDLLDEQPRVYSWALRRILGDYHAQGKLLEVTEVGPIYLNQVKKLISKFDYQRVTCMYTDEDLSNFMKLFERDMYKVAMYTYDPEDSLPTPGYMKCQMCDYADLCMHYGYANIQIDDLVKEFDGEFEVRDHDHLEEKTSRHVEE